MNFFRSSPAKRPRLTVSIQTRNSASRIRKLIDEAHTYGDEVIVGVDADSTDNTFEEVAGTVAVSYRFRHPGLMAPARLLALEHATGDWMLALDDDESMELSFNHLKDELLSNAQVTHYHFPRKQVASLSPCEYVRAFPFFPDWQLRLFRNDRSLVWKPPRVHTGYWVQGLGHHETRTNLLHFEHLWCSPERRAQKHQEYRQAGSDGTIETLSMVTSDLARWPAILRPEDPRSPRIKSPKIIRAVRDLKLTLLPDWKVQFLHVSMETSVRAGSSLIAEVSVRNVGTMSWNRSWGSWPQLNLAFRLLNHHGEILQQDGHRFPVLGQVSPGEKWLFLAPFSAPEKSGHYFLEWDMVSEFECWFHYLGGKTHRTAIHVE